MDVIRSEFLKQSTMVSVSCCVEEGIVRLLKGVMQRPVTASQVNAGRGCRRLLRPQHNLVLRMHQANMKVIIYLMVPV